MVNIFKLKYLFKQPKHSITLKNPSRQGQSQDKRQGLEGTLANARIKQEYMIKAIETTNDEMRDFLFTLGCYEGEMITVISMLSDQYVVVIKDARYSIDQNLAACIIV